MCLQIVSTNCSTTEEQQLPPTVPKSQKHFACFEMKLGIKLCVVFQNNNSEPAIYNI